MLDDTRMIKQNEEKLKKIQLCLKLKSYQNSTKQHIIKSNLIAYNNTDKTMANIHQEFKTCLNYFNI